MNSRTRRIIYTTAVLLGLGIGSASVSAKPDYAKKEKKSCTTCHVKIGSKDLNDTGKCYKDHKLTLEGCDAKQESK